jgi:hypothetical protein
MKSDVIFYAIADLMQWTFGLLEWVGDKLNYSLIILGFFGFFYWMRLQIKFNNEAKNNPNQIK